MQCNDPLTHDIIGCAMKVRSTLGTGFMEVVYQRALAIEMADRKLLFERERKIPIHYGGQAIGSRRVDFLVDRRVLVEIKAVHLLDDIHPAQALNI